MGDPVPVVTGEMADLVLLGQCGECAVEQFDVVVGVIGPGVSRTQHGGQGFGRRVAPHSEGEES